MMIHGSQHLEMIVSFVCGNQVYDSTFTVLPPTQRAENRETDCNSGRGRGVAEEKVKRADEWLWQPPGGSSRQQRRT